MTVTILKSSDVGAVERRSQVACVCKTMHIGNAVLLMYTKMNLRAVSQLCSLGMLSERQRNEVGAA
jgi:hypothetical protein